MPSSALRGAGRRTGTLVHAWKFRHAAALALLALAATAALPAAGHAATITFGSPLSVPATGDTTSNLGYAGTNTPWGSGVVHTAHDGSDTVLWNVTQASGSPAAPADGQILRIRLEGCAQPASGGPSPLTQIHFQDLAPQGGGSVKVNVTSQAFDMPICGQNGASGSTVSTYQPTYLCVKQGDFLDFNDEGGYAPGYYPSGVPYQVIGSMPGSTMDSYINQQSGAGDVNNPTGNGGVLSPNDTGTMGGFASNANAELMLQATLGTGSDAAPACGGTAGVPATPARAAVSIHPQTDGVNHSRVVKLALFCAQTPSCSGTMTLMLGAKAIGVVTLSIPGHKTSHVPVRLSAAAFKLVRRHHRRLSVTMVVKLGSGQSFSGPVTLRL